MGSGRAKTLFQPTGMPNAGYSQYQPLPAKNPYAKRNQTGKRRAALQQALRTR